ncbi:hypothetical protein DFH09DRAFT_187131 [Mycena vulgaris]|nr:hypothetical protein DFH09DRAFT_187131 [Mycena vulgaris]
MTHLGSLPDKSSILRHRDIPGPPLFARNDHETPWGFESREIRSRDDAMGLKANPAISEWCHISDADLPPPWTCRWSEYGRSGHAESGHDELRKTYGLGAVNPIMWCLGSRFKRSSCLDTLLLEIGGAFYLYDAPLYIQGLHECYKETLGPSPPSELLYRFDGQFSSIGDFLEQADWTQISLVAPRGPCDLEHEQSNNVKLPLTSDGGELRLSAPTP